MAIYDLSDIERYTLQEAHRRDDEEWDRRLRNSKRGGSPRLPTEFRAEALALLERNGYAVPELFSPRIWVVRTPGEFPRWVLTTLHGEEP